MQHACSDGGTPPAEPQVALSSLISFWGHFGREQHSPGAGRERGEGCPGARAACGAGGLPGWPGPGRAGAARSRAGSHRAPSAALPCQG